MARMDLIHIDRSKRAEAWAKVAEQGRRYMAQGNWVIMFPEGTRTPRGGQGMYKVGGTRLAVETGRPVVPIAVTSARCWPRKSFLLRPGRDRHLDRAADRSGGPQRRCADARRRGLDRGRDAPPRSRGVPMTSSAWRDARPAPHRRHAAAQPVRRRASRRVASRRRSGRRAGASRRRPRRPTCARATRSATREIVVDGRRSPFASRARRGAASASSSTRAGSTCARRSGSRCARSTPRCARRALDPARLAEQRERARAAGGRARTVWRDGATRRLPRPAADRARASRGPRAIVGARRERAPACDSRCRRRRRHAATTRLRVGLPRDAGEARIRDAVQSWLQREARRVFAERVGPFRRRGSACASRACRSRRRRRAGAAPTPTARCACTGA